MINDAIKHISEDTAKYLIDKVKIMDVIQDLTALTIKKSGVNYTALCPFHEDRHLGSFIISTEKNRCKCFSCQKGGKPIDFIMSYKNWNYREALLYIADLYNVTISEDTDRETRRRTIEASRPKPKQIQPDVKPLNFGSIPLSEVSKYRGNNSVFADYLYSVFDHNKVNEALTRYNVGTIGEDKRVIYWYIDNEGVCREGKTIKYKEDGHRDHDTQIKALAKYTYHIDSVKPSLFGENLINTNSSTIGLVEAEKTAIIMSICLPDIIWLSCGGATRLSASNWQVLKGHKVLVYPDSGQVDNWRIKVQQMKSDGIDARLKYKWQESATIADVKGYDIADIYIRLYIEQKRKTANRNVSVYPDDLLMLSHPYVYSLIYDDAGQNIEKPF